MTFFFGILQTLAGPQGCFIIFSAFCVGAVGFAFTVMPETKGKTFEEIAMEFKAASGRGGGQREVAPQRF